jgi:hypothetical protein
MAAECRIGSNVALFRREARVGTREYYAKMAGNAHGVRKNAAKWCGRASWGTFSRLVRGLLKPEPLLASVPRSESVR